ncbi:MAG: hypothetical protein QM676_09935 [Novosphingobium sp.]
MPAIQDQRMVQSVAAPQHYVPATARELRAQAIHRLQIGLFGLAAMLLIVGLANIIMDRARLGDTGAAPHSEAAAAATTGSDPLADIGVVPAPAPSGTAAKSVSQPK